MAQLVDKRREVRLPLRVPLYVMAADGVLHKNVKLESRDVSSGGLRFETSRSLPLEAESNVVISQLGDLPGPVLIRGRVAWVKPLEASGRFLVGIEFVEFEGVTREELLAKLQQWSSA
jgi:c-di-GMP-binding flagellar brake protein YcgR